MSRADIAHVHQVINVIPGIERPRRAFHFHGAAEILVLCLVHAENRQLGLVVNGFVCRLAGVIDRGGGVESLASDGVDNGRIAFNFCQQVFLSLRHLQPCGGQQEITAHVIGHVFGGRRIDQLTNGRGIAQLVNFLPQEVLHFGLHPGNGESNQAFLLGFLINLEQAGIKREGFVSQPGCCAQGKQGEKADDEGQFLIHDSFQRYPRPRMVSICEEAVAPSFSRKRVSVTATVRVCAAVFRLPQMRSSNSSCGMTRPGWVRK